MHKFSTFFNQLAYRKLTILEHAQENRLLIVLAFLLKIVANLLSAFAAYKFVNFTLTDLVKNYSTIITPGAIIYATIFFLILIELLTNAFLAFALKYSYRKRLKQAVLRYVLFALMFVLSVYSSSKGVVIGEKQASNITKNTDSIILAKTLKLKIFYADKIELQENRKQIILSNPTVWDGSGKRSGFSPSQLEKVDNINLKIDSLKTVYSFKSDSILSSKEVVILEQNQAAEKRSESSTNIIYVALFLQLVTTLFLWHSYFLSTKENKKFLDFTTNDFEHDFSELAYSMQTRFAELFGTIVSVNQQALDNVEMPKILMQSDKETKAEIKENNTNNTGRKIGFESKSDMIESTENENDIIENNKHTVSHTVGNTVKNKNSSRKPKNFCKNCGKEYEKTHHKKLYCREACRLEFWRKKNPDKTLRFKDGK